MPKISELPTPTFSEVTAADVLPIVTGGVTKGIARSNLPFIGRAAGRDWRPSPVLGPELWVVSGMSGGTGRNTSTLTPSITANGTTQQIDTVIPLGNLANRDTPFRLRFRINSVPSSGWCRVWATLTDNSNPISGTLAQSFMGENTPSPVGDYVFEFKPDIVGITGTYLMLTIYVNGNSPGGAGTLQLTNCSLREIGHVTRPLLFTESSAGAPGYPQLAVQLWDAYRRKWRWMLNEMWSDNGITSTALLNCFFFTSVAFQTAIGPPDPDFVLSGSASSPNQPSVFPATGEAQIQIRSNNNDQIFTVLKQDGTTYEYRGNTHGGESLRSTSSPDLIYEYDLLGDGSWTALAVPFGKSLKPCMRFRQTWNTQIARSAPDSDVFANVDHRTTFFPDGVSRTDRTTSFTKAMTLGFVFEWMTSHPTGLQAIGRIGSGLIVADEIDIYVRLAAPAAPTMSTATTGGTLAAGTYWYFLTALTEAGETTASPIATQVTTGTTSTVTVTWSAITGATGYQVYGRANGVGRAVLLKTLGASATSWIDDGSVSANGKPPPTKNTARRLDLPFTNSVLAANQSNAHWAAWLEPVTGLVHAMIFDRDAIADRGYSYKMRIELGAGICKTYVNQYNGAATFSVTSATVWSATHWLYTYAPSDPVNWHLEVAAKSLDLAALKSLYPAS